MCGFVGIFQNEPVIEVHDAKRALNTIAHRGPDAKGEWCEGEVFLGHRRLAIIDLETGNQPMQSSDQRYVIAFNGEIYNFIELRDSLSRNGANFTTKSDTEVILEGYRRWGSGVVERLNGMFAFVIWDRISRRVFGARDRIGIKPLCYALHRGALIVSSTLEPFCALHEFNSLDLTAVRDLMALDYIPAPRTILQGVQKLEPGNYFKWYFGEHQLNIERYWSPPVMDSRASVPDEFELENLLEHAVKRQMISDVPIGTFLSGGIDSSLLVALMARNSFKPVRTFSVGFNEGHIDESAIAELVARRFGTEHQVLRAEEIDSNALLELLGRLDEPLCDAAIVPTWALSKMTRRDVKVALSGDGADEVFGGYPKYLSVQGSGNTSKLSALFDRSLRALPLRPRGVHHLYWRTLSARERMRYEWVCYGDFPVFRKDIRQLLSGCYHDKAKVEEFFEPWERRARRYGDQLDTDVLMRTDLETYLSENCLVKTDRASMLASLEVRVPFLDNAILDCILPIPAQRKIVHGQLKALLLPIARRLLPRDVWDRPKHGFNVPIDVRLAGTWRPAVEAVLEWGESNLDLFDYRYLRHLHTISGIGDELWNPFVFLAWAMARSMKPTV